MNHNTRKKILDCAQYSLKAYETSTFTKAGSTFLRMFGPRELIIAFRGTEITDPHDIISDADADQTDTPFGRVHRGFFRAYCKIRMVLQAEVESFEYDKITLTGHSLGGALAQIALADLRYRKIIPDSMPVEIITFGSPRVGNKEFISHCTANAQTKFLRVVNRSDIIPSIPPRRYKNKLLDIDVQYRHVGEFLLVSSDGKIKPGSKFQYWWSLLWLKDLLKSHGIKEYINRIEAGL